VAGRDENPRDLARAVVCVFISSQIVIGDDISSICFAGKALGARISLFGYCQAPVFRCMPLIKDAKQNQSLLLRTFILDLERRSDPIRPLDSDCSKLMFYFDFSIKGL
jgi:hypothetical protein